MTPVPSEAGRRLLPLAAFLCALLSGPVPAGSAQSGEPPGLHGRPAADSVSDVRAWHCCGQTFVVWRLSGTVPKYCSIYRAPTPLTSTAEGVLRGRSFAQEWSGARLKLASPSLTWAVPLPGGGVYRLAADEGLFVDTPHAAAVSWYAVVPEAETQVGDTRRTAQSVVQTYDPDGDPVGCHVQLQGVTAGGYPFRIYALWSDGQADPRDARPDVPVTANAGKNGAPHLFAVYEPRGGLPPGPVPVAVCLHGGGSDGSYWEWRPDYPHYANIGHAPTLGLTVAHDDRLFLRNPSGSVNDDRPTYWFGYWTGLNPLSAGNPPNDAVVAPYTLQRVLWAQDWLERRSPYTIDTDRVAILGSSMGGMGTSLISRFRPERFASASSFVPPFYLPPTMAVLAGTPAQNLPTTENGPGGAVLRTNDFFDPARRLSGLQRDFCVSRMYRGRFENTDSEAKWGEAVTAFRDIDAAAWGVHLYWDWRDHNPYDWSRDDPATPEYDVGQWVDPVRTQRGTVDYQARYRVSASYPGVSNDDQSPDTPGRQPDPGNGTLADGTPWGTWGGYVDWEPDSLEDAPDRWACTLFLVGLSPVAVDNCPVATASLDVTIRKTRSFRPAPGAKVYWRALAQPGGAVLASGEVTGGAEGLVAVPGLRIPRDPDRVRLEIATGPFDVAPADVNGDGVVNGQDLDLLGAILAGNSLAPQDTAGDVNQDVRVDILDFLELQLLLQR